MTNLYQEHLERVRAAMDFQLIDRVPFVAGGPAVNAAITGVKLADYVSDMDINMRTNLEGYRLYGDPDACQTACFNPNALTLLWASKVKLPGKELSDNELWQVDEQEILTEDDYDAILDGDYKAWLNDVMVNRLGDPVGKLAACGFFEASARAKQLFIENGLPNIAEAMCPGPIEMFCGGRTLMNFMGDDLYEIPEKVERVFDIVQESNLADWEAQFKDPATRPLGVWIGGWRGTPDLLSPEMFQKYSWKYMRQNCELCIDYGVIPVFHLDSNWDNGIKYFKELPRHKFIIALDGMTDIFKAREVIGDHACIMGDVPASLQSFGTPEQVEAYCKKLIDQVGPYGYILCPGCDSPFNSKLECLKAMAGSVKKFGPNVG